MRLAFALRMQGRRDEAENRREAAKEAFSDVLMLDPDNATAKEQLRGL